MYTIENGLNLIARILLAAGLFGTSAQSSAAATGCLQFGDYATALATHNRSYGCGFTGGAWAIDNPGHTNWCMQPSVTDQQIQAILQERQAMITQCRDAKIPACEGYAESAVLKAREAKSMNCGYTDTSYADDYNGHFSWCLGQPNDNVVNANNKTNRGIDLCRQSTNTMTYTDLGARGALLDACTNDDGLWCGEVWVGKKFCEWKGHAKVLSSVTRNANFTVHLDCIKAGEVRPDNCYCNGNCGSFTSITCTGKK